MHPSPSTTAPRAETAMPEEYDTESHRPPETGTEFTSETRTGTEPTLVTATESEVDPNRWAKLADSLLLPVLSGAAVLMLGFILTTTNTRISDTNDRIDDTNDRIDATNDRIDALETRMNDKIDALETRMNDKIDALETKIDEINLKLTALIAALNKTTEVDNALSGVVSPAEP